MLVNWVFELLFVSLDDPPWSVDPDFILYSGLVPGRDPYWTSLSADHWFWTPPASGLERVWHENWWLNVQ